MMKKIFSFALCFSLISMRSVCACESVEIPQADHQQAEDHDGCHGHDDNSESSEPSHHACICPDHGDEGVISQGFQTIVPSLVIAEITWTQVDLFPMNHASQLYVYYHSPPPLTHLYLTQATLLL